MHKDPTSISQLSEKFLNRPKIHASSNALVDTGRPLTSINSVITEMTFLRDTSFCIELHHSKWACLETSLTSNTGFWIDQDDTIRSLRDRIDRACLFTRRFGTLKAVRRRISQFQFTVYLLDPFGSYLYPARSFRRIIFLLAG